MPSVQIHSVIFLWLCEVSWFKIHFNRFKTFNKRHWLRNTTSIVIESNQYVSMTFKMWYLMRKFLIRIRDKPHCWHSVVLNTISELIAYIFLIVLILEIRLMQVFKPWRCFSIWSLKKEDHSLVFSPKNLNITSLMLHGWLFSLKISVIDNIFDRFLNWAPHFGNLPQLNSWCLKKLLILECQKFLVSALFNK